MSLLSTQKDNLTIAPGGYHVLTENDFSNPRNNSLKEAEIKLEKPELEKAFVVKMRSYGDSQRI